MYLLFGVLLLIVLFFLCVNHRRKKKIIKRICGMGTQEKCEIINEAIEPFGYCYVPSQDIFTSSFDAWQREFGYCALYDETAYHFHLVFDSLPVYFNYKGRTWLMEFWKGQYGINTGGEAGIYCADRVLSEEELKLTLFHSVSDGELPEFSFVLYKKGRRIADLRARHWWLTGFLLGCFSNPADLFMRVSVTFPDGQMACAFVDGLERAGFCKEDISVCCNTVAFSFAGSTVHHGFFARVRIRIAQWLNRFWCRVYLFVTRPFCLSLDRVLYLYYYLPANFRRMLRIREYRSFNSSKSFKNKKDRRR